MYQIVYFIVAVGFTISITWNGKHLLLSICLVALTTNKLKIILHSIWCHIKKIDFSCFQLVVLRAFSIKVKWDHVISHIQFNEYKWRLCHLLKGLPEARWSEHNLVTQTPSIFRKLPKDHQIIYVQLERVLNALNFPMYCYWNRLWYFLQYTWLSCDSPAEEVKENPGSLHVREQEDLSALEGSLALHVF